jgi:hypothetical protein
MHRVLALAFVLFAWWLSCSPRVDRVWSGPTTPAVVYKEEIHARP